MSRYSNVVISDDNYDDEYEKICDMMNIPYGSMHNFVETLSDRFMEQDSDYGNFKEWIDSSVEPNFAIDCSSPIVNAKIAFEFSNGFMIFYKWD